FYNTPTTEIYPLSLHDALPISLQTSRFRAHAPRTDNKLAVLSGFVVAPGQLHSRCPVASKQLPIGPFQDNYPAVPASTASTLPGDRKSTRLNSSHVAISYAVFC